MSASRPLSGQSGPQPAAGPRLRAHDKPSGQDESNRREPRVLPRRWPDAARCGPVRGPAPTPYSHTPPHAGARRHAASPMTLVDAHRAARRDSPVLPVRIFPVGSRDPIRGERPSSADATETPWSCQDRGYRLGRGRCPARLPWVVPTGSDRRWTKSWPKPPPVAAPYTDRAGAVEAGDRADHVMRHVTLPRCDRSPRPQSTCHASPGLRLRSMPCHDAPFHHRWDARP